MVETRDVRATIGANIRRVRRNVRDMTGRSFVVRLEDLGIKILPSGLTAIEKGERRVTAEELLVIAQVLNASLVDLLTPPDGAKLQVAEGLPAISSDELFYWLRGDRPWPGADGAEYARAATEQTRNMLRLFDSVAVRELSGLADAIRLAETPELRKIIGAKMLAHGLRSSLDRVNEVVGELAHRIEAGDGDGG